MIERGMLGSPPRRAIMGSAFRHTYDGSAKLTGVDYLSRLREVILVK